GRQHGVRQLAPLRDEIHASQPLRERLGPIRLNSTSDANLWGEVQRLFLRLGPAEGRQWVRRAAEWTAQAGAQLTAQPAPSLHDESEVEIYPGLSGGITAPGLMLSPSAPLHPLVGEGPWEGG